MNSAYIYLQLYRMFDKRTPIKADCGALCGKACCKGDDCGMYLFPGEKKVFDMLKPDWAYIEQSDFSYTYKEKSKKVPVIFCNGKCDRYQRPLACRIFPLSPYMDKDGNISVITDPRAKAICPLSQALSVEEYDATFVKAVYRTFGILSSNKEFYAFLDTYSRQLDEYLKFFD